MSGYAVPVPTSGVYRVSLHFAELVFASSGKRVFDVLAEGSVRVDDLDVVARSGFAAAYVERLDVQVSDGTLNLDFRSVVEDPMISGIEVEQLSGSTTTAAVAPSFADRVETGSRSPYTDGVGQISRADSGFNGGRSAGPVNVAIGNTTDDRLYQTYRWGLKSISTRVPASGIYTVRLHFAETVFRERRKASLRRACGADTPAQRPRRPR